MNLNLLLHYLFFNFFLFTLLRLSSLITISFFISIRHRVYWIFNSRSFLDLSLFLILSINTPQLIKKSLISLLSHELLSKWNLKLFIRSWFSFNPTMKSFQFSRVERILFDFVLICCFEIVFLNSFINQSLIYFNLLRIFTWGSAFYWWRVFDWREYSLQWFWKQRIWCLNISEQTSCGLCIWWEFGE